MLIKFIAAAIEGVARSEYERENTKAQPMLFVESRDPRKKRRKKRGTSRLIPCIYHQLVKLVVSHSITLYSDFNNRGCSKLMRCILIFRLTNLVFYNGIVHTRDTPRSMGRDTRSSTRLHLDTI